MQIALCGYYNDLHSKNKKKAKKSLATFRTLQNLKKVINRADNLTLDQKNPNVVVSVGGDGTFLSAFHKYEKLVDNVHFVGFDTGHLGFYTDWSGNQWSQFIDSLLHHDDGRNVSYALLHVHVVYAHPHTDHAPSEKDYLALNESTIKRDDGSTLKADLYNNNSKHAFEHFRGDGFCICTPTGSTGYNKSLGGSVLCPDLPAIELTHIAPINSRTYPSMENSMVIDQDDKFTIYPQQDAKNIITFDNDKTTLPVKSMTFQVSKHRIHFVKYHHIYFWDRVSHAFVE